MAGRKIVGAFGIAATLATLIALAGCGASSSGGDTSTTSGATGVTTSGIPAPTSSAPSSAATTTAASVVPGGETCTAAGGEVQSRAATWGTNGDEDSWLTLAGVSEMCRFQADDEAQSRIYVDLVTLSSNEPTLAGLAYLSRVPAPGTTDGSNPATAYCASLGGSSTFGSVGVSGGGWVNTTDPDDVVVSLCVFPDLSFIDEWGLTYHSAGDIRGKDLATVMTYQPAGTLPPVFSTS